MIIIRRYKNNDTGKWTFSVSKALSWLAHSHNITVYDNRKERWTYNISQPKKCGYPIKGDAVCFDISFRGPQIATYYIGESEYPMDNGKMCFFVASEAGCLYEACLEDGDIRRMLA